MCTYKCIIEREENTKVGSNLEESLIFMVVLLSLIIAWGRLMLAIMSSILHQQIGLARGLEP
jgi:hypothetical protein